jgi:hypothetical protein
VVAKPQWWTGVHSGLGAWSRVSPRISGLGSPGASGMFLITLGFLFRPRASPPWNGAGVLLVKDLVLLGARPSTPPRRLSKRP